jgi:hypothetical protein
MFSLLAEEEEASTGEVSLSGGSDLNGLGGTLPMVAVVGKRGRPGEGRGEDEKEMSHSPLAMDDAGLLDPPAPGKERDSFFSFCL